MVSTFLARLSRYPLADCRRPRCCRGVFAEWLVARRLGVNLTQARDPWAPHDIVMPDGTTIEVKCGAYVQAWHNGTERSKVDFGRLHDHKWNTQTRKYRADRTFNADLYVFRIHTSTDRENWDAFDSDR
jgi:hypothetical protein